MASRDDVNRWFISTVGGCIFGAGWLYGVVTTKDDNLGNGARNDTFEYRQDSHSNSISGEKLSAKAIVKNIDEVIQALEEAKKFAEQNPRQAEILVEKELLYLQKNQNEHRER